MLRRTVPWQKYAEDEQGWVGWYRTLDFTNHDACQHCTDSASDEHQRSGADGPPTQAQILGGRTIGDRGSGQYTLCS